MAKPVITMPSWMNKGEPKKLAAACATFWEKVKGWISFPLEQTDPETCTVQILNLLAYQRDIDRFEGEPLWLYRLRIKHAFINAQDSGSFIGFKRIFDRLKIGDMQQLERQPGIDWDVIIIRVNDNQLAANATLMNEIIRKYGRTCRRYRFEVLNVAPLGMRAGWFDNDHQLISARPGKDAAIMTESRLYIMTEAGEILTV
ncbi:hypothetical protein AB6864_26230 [Serratia proteamaculans]|uniref:hypothetical protein n=1 Tax=Serratia proteamaculans TaxID=28151 RepID=UPI00101F25FE|nr:hypothetical protein [Serratia proteamaculans]RYM50765.1 hypothetical protein BSQ97_15515 [Serratia proteamaculans]